MMQPVGPPDQKAIHLQKTDIQGLYNLTYYEAGRSSKLFFTIQYLDTFVTV
jgi:hypothetical protein